MEARDGSDMSSSQVKQRITIVNSSSRESNMPLHTPRAPTLMCTPQPHTHTKLYLGIFLKSVVIIVLYIKIQENFNTYFSAKNKLYKDWDFWSV